MPSLKRTIGALMVLTVIASARGLADSVSATDPKSIGPFPVGVTTTVFVDPNRTDALTKEPRTLVTEIWYPATDGSRDLPKNKYSDFLPAGVTPEADAAVRKIYKKPTSEINKIFSNHSVRDARVREGEFRLIIFSHGNGGNRHQNTFWCDHLASHGYVIASADHTGNASMTILKGKVIPYSSRVRSNSASARPKDMSFLLDQMTIWNQGADSRFAGKLDLSAVCAAGMSFGAMSAVQVADDDPRFKSVIAMSGAALTHTNRAIPTLWMLGTEDTTIGAVGNTLIRAHHLAHLGPSVLLELKNGGHYSFTDMFKIDKEFGDGVGAGTRRDTKEPFAFTSMETTYQIINFVSLAFLDVYAKGLRERLSFLQTNHWPDEVIWQVTGVDQEKQARP